MVGGRLFVASERGVVYALDAASGCTHWTFEAAGGVRSAMTVTRLADGRHALFFGDFEANVYALDAATGAEIWRRDVEAHPGARITGAPVEHDGRLYVPVSSLEELLAANPRYPCCTFRGSIAALDAATGELLWQSYTIEEAPAPRGRNPDGARPHGAVRGGGVVSADRRRESRAPVRRDRQRLHRARRRHQRRDHRVRSRHRRGPLDEPVHAGRRVHSQLRGRQPQLSGRGRPPTSTSGRLRCW